MTVDKGFRFGSKETENFGPDWVYVKGSGQKYDEIRNSPYKRERVESMLRIIIEKQEKALRVTRWLLCAIFGGHVDRATDLAAREVFPRRDDPVAMIDILRAEVSKAVPATDKVTGKAT
jgi:hypothetical protein